MIADDLSADRRGFLAALAAAAALPSAAYGRAGGAATHPAVRALVERYVREKKVANMVVAIGGRRGAPDFLAAGTLALGRGPKAGPDSLYRIYSMTKPITACAVMLLVQDGKLTLDSPLAGIFPGFAQMTVLADPANGLAVRSATRPILIRHLLTHSAGLGYTIVKGPLADLYAQKGIVPAQVSPADEATAHRPGSLIAFAEAVAPLPLLFEPGSSWSYSIGLDVAGAVVERVAGMPLDAFLQRRILTPLGMADTMFRVPPGKLARMTTNYSVTADGLVPLDPPPATVYARTPAFPYGGAGLVSSARDYARFMAMLLGEGQLGASHILTVETARTMMSNLMQPGVLAMGNSGYGAGGRVVLTGTPGGEAAGTYGWSGAAGTTALVDRASGLYAVLMTQFMPSQSYPLNPAFGAALYGDFHRA